MSMALERYWKATQRNATEPNLNAGGRGPLGLVHVAKVARAERPVWEHEVALVDQTREWRGGASARRERRVQRRRRRRRAAVARVSARRAAASEARRPRQVRSGHLRAPNGSTH